eukprot:6178192-Pleurochrysis_carterae.AAC.1
MVPHRDRRGRHARQRTEPRGHGGTGLEDNGPGPGRYSAPDRARAQRHGTAARGGGGPPRFNGTSDGKLPTGRGRCGPARAPPSSGGGASDDGRGHRPDGPVGVDTTRQVARRSTLGGRGEARGGAPHSQPRARARSNGPATHVLSPQLVRGFHQGYGASP